MCGIAGILSAGEQAVERRDLALLAAALAHRGPDGEGLWVDATARAGFVHRRLAIIDTHERSNQPMASPDGRHTIVFNGEIYNFLELRQELEAAGFTFHTDSDTEVVLAAWRHWGESMLLRFNGMWALALHDARTGDVFFARDRFGVKPLLYAQTGSRLVFASETRALLALPWVSRALDADVTRRLLFDPFGVEGSDRSIHAAVRRLPAGHCATWRQGRLAVRRWWHTFEHLVPVPATPQEQAERFHELFVDSIRLRMRSDVSIGTCLSGGFDSSAIVCTMAEMVRDSEAHLREARDWRHAFIASFPGRSNDETPLALQAAAHAAVQAHTVDLSEPESPATIERVLADLDDIYISLPAAPWQVYRRLRQHGTLVSLDGHGADELMGGYHQRGQRLGFAVRNLLGAIGAGRRGARAAIDDAKAAWLRARGLYHLRGGPRAPAALPLAWDDDAMPCSYGPLNTRLYRMFHATVLPTILRNFDRLSMAHGVEVRMPFMDWRLVCYVMSLPDSAKLDDIGSKAVARHALVGRMPESIRINKLKVGFNSPMPEWMQGALGNWAVAELERRDDTFDALVDRNALLAAVKGRTAASRWDWEAVGRLWPYVGLRHALRQSSPGEGAAA